MSTPNLPIKPEYTYTVAEVDGGFIYVRPDGTTSETYEREAQAWAAANDDYNLHT